MTTESTLIPVERIERRILLLRGQKVMLDFDLAGLYEVETKALNQAVKRNIERFPGDFMFQLTEEETDMILRSQIVTSKAENDSNPLINSEILRSQIVTSKPGPGSGGRRYRPLAFTEQGVAMLSSVLRSSRAVQVNIAIMRTFVQLRQLLATHAGLARQLAALEEKYDEQFKVVFDAIRELMEKPDPLKPEHGREIGFHGVPTPSRNKPATQRRKISA